MGFPVALETHDPQPRTHMKVNLTQKQTEGNIINLICFQIHLSSAKAEVKDLYLKGSEYTLPFTKLRFMSTYSMKLNFPC